MKGTGNSAERCSPVGISFPPPSWIPARTHTPDNGRRKRAIEGGPKKKGVGRGEGLFSRSVGLFSITREEKRRKRRSATFGHPPPPSANGQEKKGLLLLFLLLFSPSPIPSIPPFPTRNHAGASDRVLLGCPPFPSSCFSFSFSPRGLIARGEVYRRNAFLCIHIYHLT